LIIKVGRGGPPNPLSGVRGSLLQALALLNPVIFLARKVSEAQHWHAGWPIVSVMQCTSGGGSESGKVKPGAWDCSDLAITPSTVEIPASS